MRWYAHLYTGKYAEAHRASILRGIREGRRMPSVYVITHALHSDGLLDIYRHHELKKPLIASADPLILGIAMGRSEAFEVARCIIDDLYREKGGFDIDAFCDPGNS